MVPSPGAFLVFCRAASLGAGKDNYCTFRINLISLDVNILDALGGATLNAGGQSRMPHEQMDSQQVASYLQMDHRELMKLASRGDIPCRKVQGRLVFIKSQVDHWVELRIHTLGQARLAGIEEGVSAHHGFDHDEPLVCGLIPDDGLAVPLRAKTRQAAIRSLVDLADRAGLVYARDELIAEIRSREDLCSTAVAPGVALPHPRHPLPYDIASSFVVVGLTPSGIPFGSPDGKLTRLLVLICCKDERTHLHVLARLARMLGEHLVVEYLMTATSPEQLRDELTRCEQAVLAE